MDLASLSPAPLSPPSPSNETKLPPTPHAPAPPRIIAAPPSSPPASPPPPPASSALIIFDWDDTLLSSSFLSAQNVRLDSELSSVPALSAVQLQLAALDRCVSSLLSTALSCSPHVHIITNAESGWVQLSAAKFLPETLPLLARVRVLSARSTYEALFPDCPHKWKFAAFHREVAATGARDADFPAAATSAASAHRSVISLGDSHVERDAVRAATRGLSGVRCKSVKFAERSTCEQLRRQVELVTSCFHYIHQHAGDLDLQLTVTVNPSAPEKPTAAPTAAPDASAAPPGTMSGDVKAHRESKGGSSRECEGDGDSAMGSDRKREHEHPACGQSQLPLPSAQTAA